MCDKVPLPLDTTRKKVLNVALGLQIQNAVLLCSAKVLSLGKILESFVLVKNGVSSATLPQLCEPLASASFARLCGEIDR